MEKKTKKAITFGAIGAVVGAAAGVGLSKIVCNDDKEALTESSDDDDDNSGLENPVIETAEPSGLDGTDQMPT